MSKFQFSEAFRMFLGRGVLIFPSTGRSLATNIYHNALSEVDEEFLIAAAEVLSE